MDFKELIVYQKALKLAMGIFEVSKTFPKEEQYYPEKFGNAPVL